MGKINSFRVKKSHHSFYMQLFFKQKYFSCQISYYVGLLKLIFPHAFQHTLIISIEDVHFFRLINLLTVNPMMSTISFLVKLFPVDINLSQQLHFSNKVNISMHILALSEHNLKKKNLVLSLF